MESNFFAMGIYDLNFEYSCTVILNLDIYMLTL